jgi:GTP-binding protein
MIERYLERSRGLKGVVSLIDIRHKLFDSDRQMLVYLASRRIPSLVVLTKADKLSRSKQAKNTADLLEELDGVVAPEQVLPVSAVKGTGCDSLLTAIEELITADTQTT